MSTCWQAWAGHCATAGARADLSGSDSGWAPRASHGVGAQRSGRGLTAWPLNLETSHCLEKMQSESRRRRPVPTGPVTIAEMLGRELDSLFADVQGAGVQEATEAAAVLRDAVRVVQRTVLPPAPKPPPMLFGGARSAARYALNSAHSAAPGSDLNAAEAPVACSTPWLMAAKGFRPPAAAQSTSAPATGPEVSTSPPSARENISTVGVSPVAEAPAPPTHDGSDTHPPSDAAAPAAPSLSTMGRLRALVRSAVAGDVSARDALVAALHPSDVALMRLLQLKWEARLAALMTDRLAAPALPPPKPSAATGARPLDAGEARLQRLLSGASTAPASAARRGTTGPPGRAPPVSREGLLPSISAAVDAGLKSHTAAGKMRQRGADASAAGGAEAGSIDLSEGSSLPPLGKRYRKALVSEWLLASVHKALLPFAKSDAAAAAAGAAGESPLGVAVPPHVSLKQRVADLVSSMSGTGVPRAGAAAGASEWRKGNGGAAAAVGGRGGSTSAASSGVLVSTSPEGPTSRLSRIKRAILAERVEVSVPRCEGCMQVRVPLYGLTRVLELVPRHCTLPVVQRWLDAHGESKALFETTRADYQRRLEAVAAAESSARRDALAAAVALLAKRAVAKWRRGIASGRIVTPAYIKGPEGRLVRAPPPQPPPLRATPKQVRERPSCQSCLHPVFIPLRRRYEKP